jgi:hypothetical protein
VAVVFFVVVILLVTAVPMYGLSRFEWHRRNHRAGQCWRCGYSRLGLQAATCPECGSSEEPDPANQSRLPPRDQQTLRWFMLCLLAACAGAARFSLLRAYYGIDYWADGFAFEQGWRLSPQREMYNPNSHESLVFWLLMLGLPLFAREKTARHCATWAATWTLISVVIISVMHWM